MPEILEEEGSKRVEASGCSPHHILSCHTKRVREKGVGKCNFFATCTAGCGCRWTTNSRPHQTPLPIIKMSAFMRQSKGATVAPGRGRASTVVPRAFFGRKAAAKEPEAEVAKPKR